ncbi:MAG: hypothetical protein VYC91_00710 [Acidobacteriota bacterium]|nr:hypothetical protein [Acidobacteriota bacterium]
MIPLSPDSAQLEKEQRPARKNKPLPGPLRKQQSSLLLGVILLGIWTLVGTIGFTYIEG